MKSYKNRTLKPAWHHDLQTLAQPQFAPALKGIRRGIERESLRVNADATLAKTAHPAAFGSALTHAHITTDYAEAMMELITPVGSDAQATLDQLADIHRYVYRHLGEELLWPLSMPCAVASEDDIVLAQYGSSNIGKMKTLYRQGLKHRYGSMMQTIAGIHYNFSMADSFWPVWQEIKGDRQPLQDFISECYLGLTRNFLRLGWLVPYLFGASSAVDSSFLTNSRCTLPLKSLGEGTHYLPKSTSLRMSDLGYNSRAQDHLAISYNSLHEFVGGLRQAASQPNAAFEKIGVKHNGEYRQLNANTLQDEGEFYATIRPKRVTGASERLSEALLSRGIEYVEVRSLDINPYSAIGIDLEQMQFLDALLTFCLLRDSPELSQQQQRCAKQNLSKVATCGRDLSLQLLDDETPRSLRDWGEEIFADMEQTTKVLDTAYCGNSFQAAVDNQRQKLINPKLTPSAIMVKEIEQQQMSVSDLAMSLAKDHRRKLMEQRYSRVQDDEFAKEAVASQQRQRALEEADNVSFDNFLRLSLAPLAPRQQGQTYPRCDWPLPRCLTVGALPRADMYCKNLADCLPTAPNDSRKDLCSDQTR